MISLCASALLLLAACGALARLFSGPTLYDRIATASSACMLAALACAGASVGAQDAAMLDVAFALVAGVIVFNATAYKLFLSRSFQPGLSPLAGEDALASDHALERERL